MDDTDLYIHATLAKMIPCFATKTANPETEIEYFSEPPYYYYDGVSNRYFLRKASIEDLPDAQKDYLCRLLLAWEDTNLQSFLDPSCYQRGWEELIESARTKCMTGK